MKPFELRRPGPQIERKWPTAKDYLRIGEEAIAFFAGSPANSAWRQIACRGKGRPSFAIFTVKPAPGVSEFDGRIDRLDPRSIRGAETLNIQDIDPLHRCFPRPSYLTLRIITAPRHIRYARQDGTVHRQERSARDRCPAAHHYSSGRAERSDPRSPMQFVIVVRCNQGHCLWMILPVQRAAARQAGLPVSVRLH